MTEITANDTLAAFGFTTEEFSIYHKRDGVRAVFLTSGTYSRVEFMEDGGRDWSGSGYSNTVHVSKTMENLVGYLRGETVAFNG